MNVSTTKLIEQFYKKAVKCVFSIIFLVANIKVEVMKNSRYGRCSFQL